MHHSGFTLIEALISLTIIAILAAISLPAARDFISHTQEELLQKQLIHVIQLAKHEAIAMHAPVGLCQSDNQSTCSGSWEQGQLIFLDETADGIVHSRQQIISVMQMSVQHGRIKWRSFPRYRQYLLFSPMQWMENENGTFWHCHADKSVWAMTVSKTGRTQIIYPNKKGEIKDGRGQALNC